MTDLIFLLELHNEKATFDFLYIQIVKGLLNSVYTYISEICCKHLFLHIIKKSAVFCKVAFL